VFIGWACVLAGLGLVLVPKAKLLRTIHRIDEVLTDGLPFQDYRSLIGLLEHLRCVYAAAASIMYGLYQPHGSLWVQHEGPAALIRPNGFQVEQLQRHRAALINTGGAPVTVVLRKGDGAAPPHLAVKYIVSADAATDSKPPGLGGFCHGLYWYIPLPLEWLLYLHITVLELLASGLGAITLAPYLRHAQRIRLQSDALATPFVLSRHRARSPMLQFAHHELLKDQHYRAVATNADIQHLDGDDNPFSDSVSLCGRVSTFFAALPTSNQCKYRYQHTPWTCFAEWQTRPATWACASIDPPTYGPIRSCRRPCSC
jgi:hypothetical protein